jgi:predicted transcriptional regulator
MSMTINGYVFNKLTQEQVDYVISNYDTKKLVDLCLEAKMCDETLHRLLKALNLKRERFWYHKIPKTKEALEIIKDPYISHVKAAEIFGVSESAVGHYRKSLNVSVRRNFSMNLLEEKISDILNELDYAFIYEKRIEQWSIDFYLGKKYCIDVHGSWSHSFEIQKERDVRKKEYLLNNQYKYLVINESEIENAKSLIENFLIGFPQQ